MHRLLPLLLPMMLAAADGTVVIEGESALAGDARSVAAAGALAGRAAAQDKPWNPLASVATAGWPTQVTLWLRHRHGAVCAKAISADGTQKELAWSWYGGDDWQWAKVGTFARVDLGQRLLVVRGDATGSDTELDTIVVDGTGRWEP